jgi:membrane fusion protein, multidrug efflux system
VSKILSAISITLLLFVLAGCTDRAAPLPRNASAVPVVVSKVARQSLPVELTAIGTGQAYKTVSVESQADGIVQEVHYQPGQFVQKGDLLVTLDNRPFLAALAQTQAALARDQAQDQLQRAQMTRYEELFKAGVVPRAQYDQYLATSTAAQATVRADQAAIQTAQIQLSYSSIYAPISGVVGAQLIYPGTTVKSNSTPVLAVINQVSPIYVTFSVPQQYLESIKTFMARSRLGVQATPPGDSKPEDGTLTFVNNAVDTNTGTIQLMGTFPNGDHRLWPGQFSSVVLRLAEQQNVLVVPSQTIQTGQQGDYVYVIKPDMTAAVQLVKVGRTVNNATEILQGLSAGETVVTDGQLRLAPGIKVYFTKGL